MAQYYNMQATFNETERLLIITAPYIGKSLSVNHYRYQGRFGIKTETKRWMECLAGLVSLNLTGKLPKPPVRISLLGYFKDKRSCPDLSNLHKVIADAIMRGSGINDRDFRFNDEGYRLGTSHPFLIITLLFAKLK